MLIPTAIALGSVPALAEPLAGRVDIRVREGTTAAQAVVYAELIAGASPARPASVTITQKNKAFLPRVLGLPLGATIEFPNADAIFHNVFSLSPPQPFDLGLYRAGASKSRIFTAPAAYHVFCNIHPEMAAFIVVAPSPWVTTAAADGTWRLDVPTGLYRLTALSERASPVTIETRAGVVDVRLALDESVTATGPRLNKFGKPYPKEAYKTDGR